MTRAAEIQAWVARTSTIVMRIVRGESRIAAYATSKPPDPFDPAALHPFAHVADDRREEFLPAWPLAVSALRFGQLAMRTTLGSTTTGFESGPGSAVLPRRDHPTHVSSRAGE